VFFQCCVLRLECVDISGELTMGVDSGRGDEDAFTSGTGSLELRRQDVVCLCMVLQPFPTDQRESRQRGRRRTLVSSIGSRRERVLSRGMLCSPSCLGGEEEEEASKEDDHHLIRGARMGGTIESGSHLGVSSSSSSYLSPPRLHATCRRTCIAAQRLPQRRPTIPTRSVAR
jgi:hypothetical protein